MEKNTSQIEYPPELLENILNQIKKEQIIRSARRRILFFGAAFLGCFVLVIPAFRNLQTEMANSGFFSFILLAISSPNVFLAYWRDFSMTLVESLPSLAIAEFLGVVFSMLVLFRILAKNYARFAQDMKNLFKPKIYGF